MNKWTRADWAVATVEQVAAELNGATGLEYMDWSCRADGMGRMDLCEALRALAAEAFELQDAELDGEA